MQHRIGKWLVIPFTKMTGAGNDFVLIDTIRHDLAPLQAAWASVARRLCHRTTGPGADGLLVLSRSAKADVRMRIFNPDGSEPSMCGNGIRCLARYAINFASQNLSTSQGHVTGTKRTRGGMPPPHREEGPSEARKNKIPRPRAGDFTRQGAAASRLMIETRDGIKHAVVQSAARVTIDMGVPRLIEHLGALRVGAQRLAHLDVIDAGVPHLVCWVNDVERIDVDDLGRRLRHHPRFRPAGTNVDFIQVLPPRRVSRGRTCSMTIRMRTYERGVEGETRACGTGAVAAATAVAHKFCFAKFINRTTPRISSCRGKRVPFHVQVRVPGGHLRVILDVLRGQNGQPRVRRALLEGEARELGRGTVTWNGEGIR